MSRPGLFVVGNNELVDAGRNDVSLHAHRVSEQHEGLLAPGGRGRVRHRLRCAVIVVDLDQAPADSQSPSCRPGSSGCKDKANDP